MAIVDQVKNATKANSEVHYVVTMRVWPEDLVNSEGFYELILRAVNGISDYQYGK